MSMFSDVTQVLFVHAHPGDETLSTGALIAHLHHTGHEVLVLTATRGERSEINDSALTALGQEELAIHRESELSAALGVLGANLPEPNMELGIPVFLGTPPARMPGGLSRHYLDSGMGLVTPTRVEQADDSHARTLTAAPVAEIVADIATYIQRTEPNLIVTYDTNGGCGHPDHVRLRESTLLAAQQTGTSVAEVVHQPGPGVEWFDLPDEKGTVIDALHCHESQLLVADEQIIHADGQRRAIVTSLGLRPIHTSRFRPSGHEGCPATDPETTHHSTMKPAAGI